MNKEQDQSVETSYTADDPDAPAPATGGHKSHRPKQYRFGMPSWILALLILALTGVLIWAGDAFLRSRQRIPDVIREETALVRSTATSTLGAAPPTRTPQPAAATRAPVSQPPQARRLALSEPTEREVCASMDADAAADLDLGITAYQQGDLEQAASWLGKTLAAAETDTTECRSLIVHLHLYLGNIAAIAEEYETAQDHYQAGLELAEKAADQALLYTNQAGIHYAQSNIEAALDAADSALELEPEHANAYFYRATAYRAQDLFEKAKQDLDRAIQLDPEHARAYASRGLFYHNMGAFDDALTDYGRSLELDPAAAEVYLNRGGTYATIGDLDAALRDYSQALALQPDDAEAYYNRGTVYAIQERYREALQDLDQALELRPEFAQVYGNRGLIYKAMGETEAAIADLETFMELSDNPEWQAMIEQHLAELRKAQE